jgi:hypothetical protein
MISRCVPGFPQNVAAVFLLVISIVADAHLLHTFNSQNKPGPRGAAELLASVRSPGEPVIVCQPFFFFPLLYYSRGMEGFYVYVNGQPMPSYFGVAALRGEDLVTPRTLRYLTCRRAWVVNMADGLWGDHSVIVPENWRETCRCCFPDVGPNGNVIVVGYDVGQVPK